MRSASPLFSGKSMQWPRAELDKERLLADFDLREIRLLDMAEATDFGR